MTKKQLKKIATQIVDLESKLKDTQDNSAKSALEKEIMRLTNSVTNLNDLITLDLLIQEHLS